MTARGGQFRRTYLNTTPHCDADGQVHLILRRHRYGCHVLRSISDDGQENQTDKSIAQHGVLGHGINTIDHKISTNSHEASREEQEKNGSGTGYLFFGGAPRTKGQWRVVHRLDRNGSNTSLNPGNLVKMAWERIGYLNGASLERVRRGRLRKDVLGECFRYGWSDAYTA